MRSADVRSQLADTWDIRYRPWFLTPNIDVPKGKYESRGQRSRNVAASAQLTIAFARDQQPTGKLCAINDLRREVRNVLV